MDDTANQIHEVGHRTFVGGIPSTWDAISDLQFRLLVERGLTPADVLIDVGCGALRGGRRFIQHLDRGHYVGVEKHVELLIYGVATELGLDVYRDKRPRFIVTEVFDFHRLERKPSYGIAQSLFTHLTAADLELCLTNLRPKVLAGCRLFATFFETAEPIVNPQVSNSHGYFAYTRRQMEGFGIQTGWQPHYVGEWNHPRGQRIIEFVA